MADVNMKKEEEIKRLKAEAVSLRKELEDERKLKGGKDVRSQRKVDGGMNDGVRISGSSECTSLRGKRVKKICKYAEMVINDMNEGMVIVQGGGNGLEYGV
ncbi:hypothetical protein FHG87_025161 [Trinorchestia longiramus]|nr:hypothetical protein FHG87_025161 [Trinorchestia longiramus]